MPDWLSAFGTGFMISPRLALTNNHVLPDAQSARLSQLEFNFQHGVSGLPLTTSQFDLEPDTFSRTDADLDVTIVAVAAKIARAANDDTFHFTNCSPQHKKFNQGASLWAGLEDHLLNTAKAEKLRLTVFTGPAFTASDQEFRGIHIPLAFWKIPVFRRQDGSHSASAYMISQHQLVEDMLREAFMPLPSKYRSAGSRN